MALSGTTVRQHQGRVCTTRTKLFFATVATFFSMSHDPHVKIFRIRAQNKDDNKDTGGWAYDSNGNWVNTSTGQTWCTDSAGKWTSVGCPVGTVSSSSGSKDSTSGTSSSASSATGDKDYENKDTGKTTTSTGGTSTGATSASNTGTGTTGSNSGTSSSTTGSGSTAGAWSSTSNSNTGSTATSTSSATNNKPPDKSNACADPAALQAWGTAPIVTYACVTHQRGQRCYYLYDPSANKVQSTMQPPALVIDMHGFGGCASDHAKTSGWKTIADNLLTPINTGNFYLLVAFPQATAVNQMPTWSAAGSACLGPDSVSKTAHIDDMGFIRKMVKQIYEMQRPQANVSGSSKIDPKRIYLTGYSNGCMMAQRFAFEDSQLVAAVACQAGNMIAYEDHAELVKHVHSLSDVPPNTLTSSLFHSTPFLQIHGELDRLNPQTTFTPNAFDNVKLWGKLNKCGEWNDGTSSNGVVITSTPVENTKPVRTTYELQNCQPGIRVTTVVTSGQSTSSTATSSQELQRNNYVKLIALKQIGHDVYTDPNLGSLDTTAMLWDLGLKMYERKSVPESTIVTNILENADRDVFAGKVGRFGTCDVSRAAGGRRGGTKIFSTGVAAISWKWILTAMLAFIWIHSFLA
ncbi:unnamed protein product [Amoebophrya sp. A120]|nr:unnamed protein product [Amoebophrya sp. A120]|eukprot:GSA120T00008435001.1